MIDGVGFGVCLAVGFDDGVRYPTWYMYILWMAVEGYVGGMSAWDVVL